MKEESKLPQTTITPEGLQVADTYLMTGSVEKTVFELDIPRHRVVETLNKREVKKYIDTVYMEEGYRNRSKIAALLDKLIDRKMDELDEAEVSSNKDILDLLKFAYEMRQSTFKEQIELDKASVSDQRNTQVNIYGEGQYGKLLQRIIEQK